MVPAAAAALPAPPAAPGRDAATIALVGVAHGTSHFFHMLLPPLFPVLATEFALSYSELGLLVTVFFVISGVGQALSGFVVDRVGARPALLSALGCFVGAAFAAALAQGFWGLVLAAALAGLGNCPFHPADFTILNRRVSPPRLGHAFSVHGISGNLGWALAPVFMLGIAGMSGSWRIACVAAAVLAAAVLALCWWQRVHLDDGGGRRPGPAQAAAVAEHPMAFLRLPSVWLCFSFFFWSTAALAAIQSFAAPALARMHGLPVTATAFVVTSYMICGAVGMVLGGFLVARVQRLEAIIGAALLVAAALLAGVAADVLPPLPAMAAVALAGAAIGLAGPSRDMLIRRAAPPGATGRVYGTVYSGLDVGFALAAPVFGWLLDHMAPGAVFGGAALTMLLAMASAVVVGLAARRYSPRR